ncbi:hypothetical protein Gotri_028069 [Gossypium trilobum]|uniref:Uncharacterized protein n=1 Tax=Gossypium trilobum TaxID=34281 RepID=A0A7J9FM02_9ROSI|nr:hypothetical protein [Gossypium trilobum]
MGKANGDRHLELFAFTVYGLIMFPKALGYVSVELADFLFQIEKVLLFVWMKSHFKCLYKRFWQVFVPSTKPIEEFLESEWTPNQSIEEWVQNIIALTYQEIE